MADGVMNLQAGWLISRREDLLWLIGSVFVSFGFMAAHVFGGVDAAVLWWIWIVLLDGPHIYATVSRTYLDAEEWRTRRPLLLGSLGWFLAGPACIALSAVLGSPTPVRVFIGCATIWAYWHVVRQHYGVLSLYKRKAKDIDPVDQRIDSAALYVGMLAPFVGFVITHPISRRFLGLEETLSGWEPTATALCWGALLAVAVMLAGRQVQRARRGEPVHLPKLLLLGAALTLSAVAASPYVVARTHFGMFPVMVTAFHNVQYHALIRFYHRNRYQAPGVAPERFGWAARLARSFGSYAVAGVVFTLLYRSLHCHFGGAQGCTAAEDVVSQFAGLGRRELIDACIWGFALHHYYLDQKIWRVRKDAGLNRDLRLAAAG